MIRTSFRSKLMLLTILPIVAAQLVTVLAVMRTVQEDVEQRARESLVVGGMVVREYLKSRGEQLRTSVEVLAADFGLKQATATGDSETVRSVLENHGRRIRADIGLLVDLNGSPVAGTFEFTANDADTVSTLLENISDRGAEATAILDGEAHQVFAVPLRAPVTIGWVLLGFRIDDALAGRIAALTGLDALIVAEAARSRFVFASPGHGSREADAAGPVASAAAGQLLTQHIPFVEGSAAVTVVLQRSVREAMLPYEDARRQLLVFGLALLAIVAVAGTLLSATVSRPLRTLVAASQRMITGNYGSEVTVDSHDEFGELADTFNKMRAAIAEREQKIIHDAYYDRVTDLPNRYRIRRLLADAIGTARDDNCCISVLSIRLSGMRQISTTLGHTASDVLIQAAARQLRVNLSDNDMLGHLGADEFVLVLSGQDAESARIYVDKIGRILATGISLENADVELQAVIGISEFPRHGSDAAKLLRYASIARTDAEESKEPVRIYDARREDVFVRRLRVVNDLRAAILQGEIAVWFQPKISLPEGTVHGTEALVRWHHPELGFLPPNEFVPAAEQAGTIVHLSRYVLAQAVKQVRVLAGAGYELQVSVNLSARDLVDEYLPYHVLQILKDNNVPPGQLTLEVTESSIMEDVQRAVLVLECLRDIGVRISMDDFGTGHSSLAQLRDIPLHELKIDRSFVQTLAQDRQNESIVRTTIALAHDIGLEVVAEGVEDEGTIRRLAELGCEQAQGYFISKPMTFAELIDWLEGYEPVVYAERRGPHRAFPA